MKTITVSDAFFAELQQIAGTAPIVSPVQPTPPVVPVAPPVPFVPPALIVGRSVLATRMPWTNGTRQVSPCRLTDTSFWAIHFTPASGSTLRLQGAENGAGTIQRNWIVYRADTGEVLGHCQQPSTQTTVQVQCAIGRPADPKHWEIRVEIGVEYVLAIVNYIPGASSAMYMDLFIA